MTPSPPPRGAPLRVALLAHARHPIRPPFAGGIEAHTWHLARALAARGHAVTLFASGDSDVGDVGDVGGGSVELVATGDTGYEHHLPWARYRDSDALRAHLHALYARAWRRIRAGGHDIVHNNALHPLPIERAGRDGLPMLTSLHVPPFPALHRAVDGSASPARRYAVTSARQRALWWRDPPAQAHLVGNGIDLDAWPFREGGDGSAVWAGRITPNKGAHLAVEAARLSGTPLSLVGPIEDRAYFEQRIAPYLDGRTRHLGHLDGAALAARFGRSSVLLFTPLWEEPFGLVAIEAMACGLPVACIARGAVREVVGEAGAYAEREDAAALAAAMARALAIPRAVPRRRVVERFSVARMLDGYERLYRLCRAGAARHAPA